jgi:S1-C subfamily serine protease
MAGLIARPFRGKNNQWDFKKMSAIVLIISVAVVTFQSQKKRIDLSATCGIDSINDAIRGVVSITGSEGSGSGFMIYPNIILTNNHVISFNDDLRVKDFFGNSVAARIVATDTVRDLAILEVDGLFSSQLLWRKAPIERLYDVYAVGFPTDGKDVSITKGIISSLNSKELFFCNHGKRWESRIYNFIWYFSVSNLRKSVFDHPWNFISFTSSTTFK